MTIRPTLQDLDQLISQAQTNNGQTLANLQHAQDQLSISPPEELIAVAYRSLSQILDDMVRIADVTNQIDTALTPKTEG